MKKTTNGKPHYFQLPFIQLIILFLIGWMGMSSGCVHIPQFSLGRVEVSSLDLSLPESVATPKLPLKVGALFDDELKTYFYQNTWKQAAFHGAHYFLLVGDASVKVFTQAFPLLFDEVIIIRDIASLTKDGVGRRAIIRPKIKDFSLRFPEFLPSMCNYKADVSYEFMFYDSMGNLLTSWTVSGTGTEEIPCFSLSKPAVPSQVKEILQRVTGKAIKNAANKFIQDFSGNSEIREWLGTVSKGLCTEGKC